MATVLFLTTVKAMIDKGLPWGATTTPGCAIDQHWSCGRREPAVSAGAVRDCVCPVDDHRSTGTLGAAIGAQHATSTNSPALGRAAGATR